MTDECVYLVGTFDEECDIQYALLGPVGLDLKALEEAFQKETDLWYPAYVPDASVPPDEFVRGWQSWRDGYRAFRQERHIRFERYGGLLGEWLVRYHGCRRVPFELIEV